VGHCKVLDGSTAHVDCHRLHLLPRHHMNDPNRGQPTWDSKRETAPMPCTVAWALGHGELPHDPITIKTAHPRHHSTSPNNPNEDPCNPGQRMGPAPMPPYVAWVLGNGKLPRTPYPSKLLTHITTAPSQMTMRNRAPRSVNEGQRPCHRTWHGCSEMVSCPGPRPHRDRSPMSPQHHPKRRQ